MKMSVTPGSRGIGPRGLPGKEGKRGAGVISWRGEWNAERNYELNEAVKFEGSSYICLLEHSGKQPENEKYWDCIAEKGSDGKAGEGYKGDRGEIGPDGKSIQGEQGIQGKQGDSFVWKGQWSFAITYRPLDVVAYRGNTFVCLAEHTNQTPTIGSYWDLMVQKGDTGLEGKEGKSIKGETGKDGVGVNWKGDWSADGQYAVNDSVSFRGSSFICIYKHSNQQPPNASYWGLLSGKGDTGSNGRDGVVIPGGRLSLVSGIPTGYVDVKSTELFYTPYVHDQLSLYNGNAWQTVNFTETSVSIPNTANQVFDAFAVFSRSNVTIELCGWNMAVRATDLQRVNGRLTKSGDPTRLYLGSVCTNADGVAEDSQSSRLLFNAYHQIPRVVRASKTAAVLIGLEGTIVQWPNLAPDTPAAGYHEYGPVMGCINV